MAPGQPSRTMLRSAIRTAAPCGGPCLIVDMAKSDQKPHSLPLLAHDAAGDEVHQGYSLILLVNVIVATFDSQRVA